VREESRATAVPGGGARTADLWSNGRKARPNLTTVTLSFDLKDPESALAFRQCISAEGLADGLLAYHEWAHSQTEGVAPGDKADIPRAQATLDKELGKRQCNWVLLYPHAALKADATWERPRCGAQVTAELGHPWEATTRAQSLFGRVVAHNQWLMSRVGEPGVTWKEVVQNLLAEPDAWLSERIQARYVVSRGRLAFFRTKQALPREEP